MVLFLFFILICFSLGVDVSTVFNIMSLDADLVHAGAPLCCVLVIANAPSTAWRRVAA